MTMWIQKYVVIYSVVYILLYDFEKFEKTGDENFVFEQLYAIFLATSLSHNLSIRPLSS